MELHQWRIRSGAIHLHLNTGLEEILLHGYDGEPAIKARQGGNLAANNLCHVGRLLVFFEWYLVSQAMPDRVGDWQLYRLIGLFLTNLVFTAVLAAIALLYLWVRFAKSLPDLQGWHLQEPESEFCAVDATSEYTLENYLEQEAKVFKELDVLIAGPWKNQQSGAYNRYQADSVSNPETITDRNWNRSYVLQAPNPIGGVLLVHGLSDAPYSLRAFGMRLHTEGYTVVWLRVPGHGTCPSALANVSWQDWTAAVKIAMCGLRDLLPHGSPLFLGGYSSGGALSLLGFDAGVPRAPSRPCDATGLAQIREALKKAALFNQAGHD